MVLDNSKDGRYTEGELAACYCHSAISALVKQYGLVDGLQRVKSSATTTGICGKTADGLAVLQGFAAGYGALLAVLLLLCSWAAKAINSIPLHLSAIDAQVSQFRTELLLSTISIVAGPFVVMLSYNRFQSDNIPGPLEIFNVSS
jgi:hypothetical protein